eukprot:1839484-Pleurochrysis_carterae.AAC.1
MEGESQASGGRHAYLIMVFLQYGRVAKCTCVARCDPVPFFMSAHRQPLLDGGQMTFADFSIDRRYALRQNTC